MDRFDDTPAPKPKPKTKPPQDPNINDKKRLWTWDDFVKEGIKLRRLQDEAIRGPSSDKRRETVKTNYDVTKQELDLTSVIMAEFPQELVRLTGIKPDSQFREDHVRYNEVDQAKKIEWQASHCGSLPGPWAINAYSKDHRAIIATWNFRAMDLLPNDKQLPWSEIAWQGWELTAPDRTEDLQWVIQSNVVNDKTLDIMADAYKKMGYKAGERPLQTFERGKSADMDDAFHALGGTDNVSGAFRLMADKTNALGGLKVKKIHTWFRGCERVTYSYIVVELGR